MRRTVLFLLDFVQFPSYRDLPGIPPLLNEYYAPVDENKRTLVFILPLFSLPLSSRV